MNINKKLIFNLSFIDVGEFEDPINSYYEECDCVDLYTYYNKYFLKLNDYNNYSNKSSYKFTDLQNWRYETILHNINKS